MYKFFKESDPDPDGYAPADDSSFDVKLLYVLIKLDERFRSGVFQKAKDNTFSENKVVEKAESSLPSVYVTGTYFIIFTVLLERV